MYETIDNHTNLGSWKDVLQVTATHCAICRRALTDADSVELGIGPICRDKFYSTGHVPSPEQVLEALGWITTFCMQGVLPEILYDTILKFQENGREACNILVYWASAHYEDRDKVCACAQVVRAFGYTALADKLEEDRSRIHLFHDPAQPDTLVLRTVRMKYSFQMELARHTKGVRVGTRGHYEVYHVPAESLSKLEILLGAHCGGELAATKKDLLGAKHDGVVKIKRCRLSDLDTLNQKQTGGALAAFGGKGPVRLSKSGSAVAFTSPYNGGWLAAFKNSVPLRDRRWDGSTWIVEASHEQTLKDLALQFFGVTL